MWRVRSHGKSQDVRSLLKLASEMFAKILWRQQINRDWLENRILSTERVIEEFNRSCGSTMPLLPTSIKEIIVENIDTVRKQIMDEFPPTRGPDMLVWVFEKRKWRGFVPQIWNLVKQNIQHNHYRKIFQIIWRYVDYFDSDTVHEDEVSFYLNMWKSIAKDSRLQIIISLSNNLSSWRRRDFPRVRFFIKLLMEFDAKERKEIWSQSYMKLISTLPLSNLEPLMRLCFDDEEHIIEFKRQLLVQCFCIDEYCLGLIKCNQFADLDEFLKFCSADEQVTEEFIKRMLRLHFAIDPFPRGYKTLLAMVKSTGWISRMLKSPEFRSFFVTDKEKLKVYCYKLIDDGSFGKMNECLDLFLSSEDVLPFLQEVVRSYMVEGDYGLSKHYIWLYSPNAFSSFIDRMFATPETAARFKKKIMFSDRIFQLFLNILYYYKDGDFNEHSTFGESRMECVERFAPVFLPSEQDISKWKDDFMAYCLIRMKRLECPLFLPRGIDWSEFAAWFLDSQEKVSRFKANLSMDEILSCYLTSCEYPHAACATSYFNDILYWYYSDTEEHIVQFKLRKLHESGNNQDLREKLLASKNDEFDACATDAERLAVLHQTLSREEHARCNYNLSNLN